MRRTLGWGLVALVLALGLVPAAHAQEDDRTLTWRQWDVDIVVDSTANQFTVTETYAVTFDGTFRFGTRVIERTNLNDLTDFAVTVEGDALRASCNGNNAGTFCVTTDGDETTLRYNFPRVVRDETVDVVLSYTVEGALRSYEGGDQLWWTAIPREHFGFPIEASTVTVTLPDDFGPREGVDPVVSYGARTNVSVRGETATFTTTERLTGNDYLEVRVQYPHNPAMRAPGWQAGFDARQAAAPLLNFVGVIGGLLLGIGGPLGVFALYFVRGRDPQIGPVPDFLEEPPSDLSPAIVGSLVDERADVRDVMAVLLDLAERGYLVMEESREEGFFGMTSSTFVFKRTDKPDNDLHRFEVAVLEGVFGRGRMERSLTELKNRFYTKIPIVQSELYNEMVRLKLFTGNPNTTRVGWAVLGVALAVLGGVGFFFLLGAAQDGGGFGALALLPLGLVATGAATLVLANFMPAKTREGAEESAKWNAFRKYLQNLERYTDAEARTDQFARFLPYATAFGLDKTWIRRFSKVPNTPIPTWYYPTYMGGPWGGGYIPGTPMRPFYGGNSGNGGLGDLGGAGDTLARAGGGFSLDSMSEGIGGGLDAISNGLTQMLDNTASTFTSQPSSSGSSGSWGSGGGGFSGGGSGGGSSGGGSSGFG